MSQKQLRVGAIQMDCQPCRVQENLEAASGLIRTVAGQGAELILLPELMPSGYRLTEEIWECAEPIDGPFAAWFQELAGELGVYLGATFLEAEGEDFYNTFILAAPGGQLAGRVRKSPPASLEAFFYRAGTDAHVLETEIGRIGVGICYENLLYERLEDLGQAQVDLVLQPTAAGRPKPMKPGDLELFDRMIEDSAAYYARALGVPVILADRAGLLHSPLPGGYDDMDSSFPGFSQVVDGDGIVLAKLGEAPGYVLADIQLDPCRKKRDIPPRFGDRWAFPVPWYAFIWPQTQAEGEQGYASNPERKKRASEIREKSLAHKTR
jgi:N-carbamoylputrescine amidase